MKLWKKGTLLILSIVLLILPTYKITFTIWFAFAPLLYLAARSSFKEYAFYATFFSLGTTYNWLYWISNYKNQAWQQAAGIWIIYLLVVLITTKLVYDKFGDGLLFILTPAVVFAALQLFKINSLRAFWLNFGFLQPATAPLIWIGGGLGIIFLIITFNALVASSFRCPNKIKLIVSALVAILILGSITYSHFKSFPAQEKIKIGLVQLKIRRSWEWRVAHTDFLIEQYKHLTDKLKKFNPDLVVWPEYAIPADIYNNIQLKKKISSISENLNCTLVIGSLEWAQEKNHTDNALVFEDGKFKGKYDSLVAFPTDPTDPIVLEGNAKDVFHTKTGNFTTNLCYEEVTPNIVRKNSPKTDYLIFMANNQDMFSEKAKYLASLFARLRSAENKRFGIRAANHGYSQIISPAGKVIAKSKRKILKGEIPLLNLKSSFYSKHGNLVVNFFILLYCGLLINEIWLKLRP